MTKRQLRQPVVDAIERGAARFDDEVLGVWQSAPAQDAIRAFLDRTLRKKR